MCVTGGDIGPSSTLRLAVSGGVTHTPLRYPGSRQSGQLVVEIGVSACERTPHCVHPGSRQSGQLVAGPIGVSGGERSGVCVHPGSRQSGQASVEIGVSGGEAVVCVTGGDIGPASVEIGVSGGEAVGCALQAGTSGQLVLRLA